MNIDKLLKNSIDVTGKIPLVLKNKLESVGVIVDGLIVGGNDINLTFNTKGADTNVAATFVGNGKWVLDELEDNANLFPEYDEGDSVSADMFTKLFINSINSGLILSFNPLGRVKYGLREVGKNIKDVGTKVVDWVADRLYAEDAEKWIRGHGPYRRTFTDSRDGKTRTKKDYNAGSINVGKIENLNGQGHYKVLTGNPQTQDFQVWHLYKNGNQIRCLDVKTGLQAQEAQWVYDNNIPDSWSESDWNPTEEIPEKATQIEIGKGDVEEDNVTDTSQTDSQEVVEEDNVVEENQSVTEENEQVEEDNVIDDMDPDTWFAEDDVHETITEEEDNVTEEPKKKKKTVAASFVKSSIEDSDSDFGGYLDEDNVLESKKEKSKYNGKNVTGYQDGMLGEMACSSLISCNLILSKIEDFQQYIKKYELGDEPRKVLSDILGLLVKLPSSDRNAITESSDNNILRLDFSKTNLTNEIYVGQFVVNKDDIQAVVNMGKDTKGNAMKIYGDDAIKMCKNTLESIINHQTQS